MSNDIVPEVNVEKKEVKNVQALKLVRRWILDDALNNDTNDPAAKTRRNNGFK